jgi:hypothetical protein
VSQRDPILGNTPITQDTTGPALDCGWPSLTLPGPVVVSLWSAPGPPLGEVWSPLVCTCRPLVWPWLGSGPLWTAGGRALDHSWTTPACMWTCPGPRWYSPGMELMALALTAYLAAMVPSALLVEDNQPLIAALVVLLVLALYHLVLRRISPANRAGSTSPRK